MYMPPRKIMDLAHFLSFFYQMIYIICNQNNKNNNMKLNSTSSEPYIRLQRAIRLQNKLNGKIRLSSFSLKYTSEYNPTR